MTKSGYDSNDVVHLLSLSKICGNVILRLLLWGGGLML